VNRTEAHVGVDTLNRVVRFLYVAIRTIITTVVIGPFLPILILVDVLIFPFFGYGFVSICEAGVDHIRLFEKVCGWNLYKSNTKDNLI
jgi:hypothetical protein